LLDCPLTRNLVGQIPADNHVAVQRLDAGLDGPLDDRRLVDVVAFGEFPDPVRNGIGGYTSALDACRYKSGTVRLCPSMNSSKTSRHSGTSETASALEPVIITDLRKYIY
jgi:hypothetical protein